MSAIGFLVLLILAIALLMALIMKVKLHPTFSLFITALIMGVVMGFFEPEGFSIGEVLALINNGFGSTLGSMGIPIMLGAILAMGVQDTGAAKSIANFFIRLFRGKNLELAPALTAYIVSIPVFGDITTILTSNIANVLSKRKHISMGKMAAFTQTGLNLTHAMVPPTPGILAVTILLGADLGLVIGWGVVISIIGFMLTWLVLRKWTDKEWVEPLPEVAGEIQETKSDDVKDILITGDDLPGTFPAFLTILIPVVLIAGSSFLKMAVAEGTTAYTLANIFGDKVVALGLGVIYTMFLAASHKEQLDCPGPGSRPVRAADHRHGRSPGQRHQSRPRHQRPGGPHRELRRSRTADSVPDRRHHVHRRGLHDHGRHDRRRRGGPHDGHSGPDPRGHGSGHRRGHHDFQPREQLRLLGHQPLLQPGPEAGPEVHHHPRPGGRRVLLHPDCRRRRGASVLKNGGMNGGETALILRPEKGLLLAAVAGGGPFAPFVQHFHS